MFTTYYDQSTGHRLQLIELRGEVMALFKDLDAPYPTYILCNRHAVNLYPKPKGENHAI